MNTILYVLIGCSGNTPKEHMDTTDPSKDTGLQCEDQESIPGPSILPHVAGTLTSVCTYGKGMVSPEGNAVVISSEFCSETQNAEGSVVVYSFPELELKFEMQGSYPAEFLGANTNIGQVEDVGTGPLVTFSWLEENAYPGTLYGGADLYDINTNALLTRVRSMQSWPGRDMAFLDNFWVLGDPFIDRNNGQIQLYDMYHLQSEMNPSNAIAIHHGARGMVLSEPYTLGDSDGDGLKDLLVEDNRGYWFLSQEDAVYDDGIAYATHLPLFTYSEYYANPASTPDWNGDGLEDIAVMDTSRTDIGDVRIVSPMFQWPLATYITSDHEVLGVLLQRVEGFGEEGEESLLVDKAKDYVGPTSYYFLQPGGCGTLEITDVGSPLIQDELPIGYSTIWGEGELLMFFPEQDSENTEHPIYLLTPNEE